ncbi:MAG: DUF4160 domain-containing protein [Flavobacteriaceae bacterium]|jgi:hypothetical protein|nr:DUF4160 domain-containing protein [Flavobacteriaceae bacterium]
MSTILFLLGFRFMIYTRDHAPAHIHVHKNGKSAKIAINPVSLMENKELSGKDLKIALKIVEENKLLFQTKWIEMYGNL